jgi:hypothetical protein
MKRSPEEKRKELGQAWHYLDPYPWPGDLASQWACWAFQGSFPRTTESRVKLIKEAIEGFAADSDIRLTRDILRLIEKEAKERELSGLRGDADVLRSMIKILIEGKPAEAKV